MAMVLRRSRLRLTEAIYFGMAPGVGSGTVTSVTAGTGITLVPNPIVTTGTVNLIVPVTVPHGGTGAITLTGLLKGNGVGAITGGASADLTTDVTGILPVPNGGSGAATLTGLLRGTGVTPFTGAAKASLTTEVTGILPYANGGTNAATAWTQGSVLFAAATSFGQDNANFFWDATSHLLGLKTAAPTRELDLTGTQRWRGVAAPAVSEANSGTIYFDSTSKKFRASLNGSPYVDIIGSAGLTGSGVAGKLPIWTAPTVLSNAANLYVDAVNDRLGLNVAVPGYRLDMNGDLNMALGNVIRIAGNTVFSSTFVFGTGALLIGGNQGGGIGDSTAVGYGSMAGGGGGNNTAVGKNSMGGGALGTAQQNTAIGISSLLATTGDGNTALGNNAGLSNTTGIENVFLGAETDALAGNLTNAVAIGYQAQVGTANSMVLGNGSMNVGIRTSTPTMPLDVNGTIGTRHNDITLFNGANQDVAPTAFSFIRIMGPSAPFDIGGFTSGVDGRIMFLRNVSGFQMVINHLDGGSAAANQIFTPILGPINCIVATLIYDGNDNLWVVMSYA